MFLPEQFAYIQTRLTKFKYIKVRDSGSSQKLQICFSWQYPSHCPKLHRLTSHLFDLLFYWRWPTLNAQICQNPYTITCLHISPFFLWHWPFIFLVYFLINYRKVQFSQIFKSTISHLNPLWLDSDIHDLDTFLKCQFFPNLQIHTSTHLVTL